MVNFSMFRLAILLVAMAFSTQAPGMGEACPEYQRKNVPLAKQIKEDLKADARLNGLPERLMYLFDQLGDCPMCIGGSRENPIWPVIVIDYVDNDHPNKPRSLRNRKSIMVPWTGDMEYLAREGMREGYVKAYHVLLETTPCECCEATTEEAYDEWNMSEPDPQDSPTWDPELDLDTAQAYSEDDPDNLGEDPADLVAIPEDKREWEMTVWPPLVLPPPARPMTTLCTPCQTEVRTHNDFAVRINQHARVIARLVRSREFTRGLMYDRLRKLRALKQRGSTPEILAERERLWTEFEQHQGQFNRESLQLDKLTKERRALLTELETYKAAVRACEARCVAKDAQALPATLPSPVTETTELPGKTRIASQACPGCEQALSTRNDLARQMNLLVDAMAGTAVTEASLQEWENLRKQLVEANETLQTCLSLCDDPGALQHFNSGNTVEGLAGTSGNFDIMELVTDWCPDLQTSDLPPQYWIDYLKEQARQQGIPENILAVYDRLPKCNSCLKRFMNGNTLPYFVYPRDGYPNEWSWTPWERGWFAAPELVRMGRMPGFYVTLDIGPCPCCPTARDVSPTGEDTYPPGAGLNETVTLDFTEPDNVKAVFYDAYHEQRDFSPPTDTPQEDYNPPAPTWTPISVDAVCDACRPIAEVIEGLEAERSNLYRKIFASEALVESYRSQLAELEEARSQVRIDRALRPDASILLDRALHLGSYRFGTTYLNVPMEVNYDSTIKLLEDQIQSLEEKIETEQGKQARLRKEVADLEAKIQSQVEALAHCVATQCKNQLISGPDVADTYITTACEPCRELVKEYNDWLRARRAQQPDRATLENDLRSKNPGFSEEEITRAADQLEKQRQQDEHNFKLARLEELRACEKRHCSETELDACQDGDVTVDENGVQFSDQPCRGVERDSQQQAGFLPTPNDPALRNRGRIGPDLSDSWGTHAINLFTAGPADHRSGQPTIVAVIDSGTDLGHPDLSGMLWENPGEATANRIDDEDNGYVDDTHGWNFVSNTPDVTDYNGHGTLVAGIIGAASNNGRGIAGINPWAKLMTLKVTDRRGKGDSLDVARAIAYAVNNGARVINISLGGSAYSPAEKAATEYARRKGVVVIAAAGNQGASADAFWPAGLPGVITVAATGADNARSNYSNWGQAVDIAAPGTKILSLRAHLTDPMAFVDENYVAGSHVVGEEGMLYHATGTSFAAPHVAGVASLLLSFDPALTAGDVRNLLLQTASDIESPGVDLLTGYGVLDATAALTSDPQFFIEASIVAVAPGEDGKTVRVIGTADADQFSEAIVEMGKGETPDDWETVSTLRVPVKQGDLATVPVSALAGSASWTLRIQVNHRDGRHRVGVLPLVLQ